MNIEESVEYLKKCLNDEYNFKNATRKKDKEAIETLLTAYENLKSYNKGTKEALRVAEDLEHQANKEAGDWEARCFELESELEKEKEKNKELESDIQQKNFEIKCLNSDIKNMYCEEGVIAILEDNFDLSREEAIQILEEE